MGNGIAHVFARSGYNVLLCDVEQRFLDRGLDTIAKNHSLCGSLLVLPLAADNAPPTNWSADVPTWRRMELCRYEPPALSAWLSSRWESFSA